MRTGLLIITIIALTVKAIDLAPNCGPGCIKCMRDNKQCDECSTGAIIDGKCGSNDNGCASSSWGDKVSVCDSCKDPSKQVISEDSLKCVDVTTKVENCESYSRNGYCSSCSDGYLIQSVSGSSNKCVKFTKIDNCEGHYFSQDTLRCSNCAKGYSVDTTGKCAKNDITDCLNENKRDTDRYCAACNEGKTRSLDQKTCSAAPKEPIDNCISYYLYKDNDDVEQSNCLVCKEGYSSTRYESYGSGSKYDRECLKNSEGCNSLKCSYCDTSKGYYADYYNNTAGAMICADGKIFNAAITLLVSFVVLKMRA